MKQEIQTTYRVKIEDNTEAMDVMDYVNEALTWAGSDLQFILYSEENPSDQKNLSYALVKLQEESKLSGEWYAILDMDYEEGSDHDARWYLVEKDFFDKNGYCDYVEDPPIPWQFVSVVESGISCCFGMSIEKQKEVLKNFGFIVDNVPKWRHER